MQNSVKFVSGGFESHFDMLCCFSVGGEGGLVLSATFEQKAMDPVLAIGIFPTRAAFRLHF